MAAGVVSATIAEAEAEPEEERKKNPHAGALGKLGGSKGGKARGKNLSAEQRKEIAQKAARARWRKAKSVDSEEWRSVCGWPMWMIPATPGLRWTIYNGRSTTLVDSIFRSLESPARRIRSTPALARLWRKTSSRNPCPP